MPLCNFCPLAWEICASGIQILNFKFEIKTARAKLNNP